MFLVFTGFCMRISNHPQRKYGDDTHRFHRCLVQQAWQMVVAGKLIRKMDVGSQGSTATEAARTDTSETAPHTDTSVANITPLSKGNQRIELGSKSLGLIQQMVNMKIT